MVKVSGYTSEYVFYDLKHGDPHSNKGRNLQKVFNVFRSRNLALFTEISILSIRKSTKRQKLQNKKQGNIKFKAQTSSRSSKDREID